jgi:hypothetical protein
MMAERRLVILKEAQDFKQLEALEAYTEAPSITTIFVVCYKHKTFENLYQDFPEGTGSVKGNNLSNFKEKRKETKKEPKENLKTV